MIVETKTFLTEFPSKYFYHSQGKSTQPFSFLLLGLVQQTISGMAQSDDYVVP